MSRVPQIFLAFSMIQYRNWVALHIGMMKPTMIRAQDSVVFRIGTTKA